MSARAMCDASPAMVRAGRDKLAAAGIPPEDGAVLASDRSSWLDAWGNDLPHPVPPIG